MNTRMHTLFLGGLLVSGAFSQDANRGPLASMPMALLFDDGTGGATQIYVKFGDANHTVIPLDVPPPAGTPVPDYRMTTLDQAFRGFVDPNGVLAPLGIHLRITSLSTGNDTSPVRLGSGGAFEYHPAQSGGWSALSLAVAPGVQGTNPWLIAQSTTPFGTGGEILTTFVQNSILPVAIEGEAPTGMAVYQEHSASTFTPGGALTAIPRLPNGQVSIIGMDAALPMVYQRMGLPDPLIMPNVTDIFFTLSPAFRDGLRAFALQVAGQVASSATVYRMTWNPSPPGAWGNPAIEASWTDLQLHVDDVVEALSVGPGLLTGASIPSGNIVTFSHDPEVRASLSMAALPPVLTSAVVNGTRVVGEPKPGSSNPTFAPVFDLGFGDKWTAICQRDPDEARFAPAQWSSPYSGAGSPRGIPADPPKAIHLSLSRILTQGSPRIDIAVSGWGGVQPQLSVLEMLWAYQIGPMSYSAPLSLVLGIRDANEFNKIVSIPFPELTSALGVRAQIQLRDSALTPISYSYPVIMNVF